MFSTATCTLLLFISLSAFVVNGVMAKKKKVDLAGQYFAIYSYYNIIIGVPSPGATYRTFLTVDNLDRIEWRECDCYVDNGSNIVTKNAGTATLLNDNTGDYRVNVINFPITSQSRIDDGFTYIGRKTKGKKNKLRYSLQSFYNTGTFTAMAKPTEEQLDNDACPVDGFATNCGLEV